MPGTPSQSKDRIPSMVSAGPYPRLGHIWAGAPNVHRIRPAILWQENAGRVPGAIALAVLI